VGLRRIGVDVVTYLVKQYAAGEVIIVQLYLFYITNTCIRKRAKQAVECVYCDSIRIYLYNGKDNSLVRVGC
jgi:hypothetical protein